MSTVHAYTNDQNIHDGVHKKFAEGCSRDVIKSGAEKLGWELDDLIEKTLLAMQDREDLIEEGLKKEVTC